MLGRRTKGDRGVLGPEGRAFLMPSSSLPCTGNAIAKALPNSKTMWASALTIQHWAVLKGGGGEEGS